MTEDAAGWTRSPLLLRPTSVVVNPLIRRANVTVRADRPFERESWEYTVREQDVVLEASPRRSTHLTFVFFRSSGCRFDRRGDCTMCNYGASAPVAGERMVAAVRAALAERPGYESLGLSPFGNMFDTQEVPGDARREIFELAAATDARTVSCESRPETITPAAVAETAAILGDKRLYVNLGLETSQPWLQANCVGKSLDMRTYATAAALLAEYGGRTVTNILLGVPFLSEAEVIADTVGTVLDARANGSNLNVLFPCNVKGYTLQEWLWHRGLYRSPSLWSLVEVLRRLGPTNSDDAVLSWYATEVSDADNPRQVSDPVRAVPTTCPECRDEVVGQLAAFNATGDFQRIADLDGVRCACRTAWQSLVEASPTTDLLARVADAYAVIGRELLGDAWWEAAKGDVLGQLESGYEEGLVSRRASENG